MSTDNSELAALKERATLMGISFHPNSKEASLKAKITAALDNQNPDEVGNDDESDPADNGKAANSSMPDLSNLPDNVLVPTVKVVLETPDQKRARLRLAGTKLIRVLVHCNNPMKKEWQGEQFTVSNRNLGTINRFVPFDQEWHVEAAILDMMRDRQYLGFHTRKVGAMKLEVKEPKFVREFNVEVLDPLTKSEIQKLAVKQALQGGDTDAAAEQV